MTHLLFIILILINLPFVQHIDINLSAICFVLGLWVSYALTQELLK